MTNKNIVIFSSGVSEKNGITGSIKKKLNEMGYLCTDWRNLFANAHDAENIALLPTLIKKIPTFDFAVLICEGHDTTYISRGEDSEFVKTMRDNVLFEIGLCAMAIGLNRTILVTDEDVRLPDDLCGINGLLAVKRIVFSHNITLTKKEKNMFDVSLICEQIDSYINKEKDCINQVVIGAAASGACGYASNFICRTLEHIDDELIIDDGKQAKAIRISPDRIHMHIVLPNNLDKDVIRDIREKQKKLLHGTIPTARNRPAEFCCYFKEEELHIVDYPTNIVTSYDTARIILQLDADDTFDETASERFVAKEMALFEATLKAILNYDFIQQVIEEHYYSEQEEKKEKMRQNVLEVVTKRLTIIQYE